MIPASLRHPSVVVCAIACVLATGILTAHAFFPRGAGGACPWPMDGGKPSENFLTEPLPLHAPDYPSISRIVPTAPGRHVAGAVNLYRA